MSRDERKTEMRDRILQTVDKLFYSQGIRAVGVDTVADAVGISKRTLYNHFPSKDDLIEAYLRRRFRTNPASDEPPAAQILGNFDRIERVIAARGFRGCPFVNAVAELGDGSHKGNDIALQFKEQQRLWVLDLLRKAGARHPETLATQIAILIDGAIVNALVRQDPSVPKAARDAARALLKANGVSV